MLIGFNLVIVSQSEVGVESQVSPIHPTRQRRDSNRCSVGYNSAPFPTQLPLKCLQTPYTSTRRRRNHQGLLHIAALHLLSNGAKTSVKGVAACDDRNYLQRSVRSISMPRGVRRQHSYPTAVRCDELRCCSDDCCTSSDRELPTQLISQLDI